MTDDQLYEILKKDRQVIGYLDVDETTTDGSTEWVLSAMREAVQKGSIEFLDYLETKNIVLIYKQYAGEGDDHYSIYERPNAEQLYQQYLQSLTK